jgi:hypothetical protein
MPEGKHIIRYESPEVFESLTKEWSVAKAARRTRRRTAKPNAEIQLAVELAVTSDSVLDQIH